MEPCPFKKRHEAGGDGRIVICYQDGVLVAHSWNYSEKIFFLQRHIYKSLLKKLSGIQRKKNQSEKMP
jgi:hypothetical protein